MLIAFESLLNNKQAPDCVKFLTSTSLWITLWISLWIKKLVDNVDMWITLSTACGYVDNLIVGIFRKFDKFRIYFQKICRAIFLVFFGLVTDVRAPS